MTAVQPGWTRASVTREATQAVPTEPRARLRIEPVHELPEAHAAHLGHWARTQNDAREGAIVRAVVPRLEVIRERQRRAISVVARAERVPQAAVRLALDRARRRLGDRLVRKEVVVHREDSKR